MIRARVPLIALALSAAVQVADVPCVFAGPHDALITKHAAANGVPEALIRRVIHIESKGNPRVISKGNYGLMQIRLGTARGMGYRGNEQGLLDADTNMTYAVKYLAGAYRAAGCNEARAISYYQKGYYGARRSKCATPQTQIAAAPAKADKISADQSAKPAPITVAAREPEAAHAPVGDVLRPRVVRTQTIVQPRHEQLPAKPAPAKTHVETVAKAEPPPAPQPVAKVEPVPAPVAPAQVVVVRPEIAPVVKPGPVAVAKHEPVIEAKAAPVVEAKPTPPAPAPRMTLASALSIPKPKAEPAHAPAPTAARPDTESKPRPPVVEAKLAPPPVEPSQKPVMKVAAAPPQAETKPGATHPNVKPAPAPTQVAAVPAASEVPSASTEVVVSTMGKIDIAAVPLPVAKPEPKVVETKVRKKKRERVAAAKPVAAESAPELEQAAEKSIPAEPNLAIAKVEPDVVPLPAAKPDVMPAEKPEQRSHQRTKRKYVRSSRKAQPTDLLTALKNLVTPDKRSRRSAAR